MGGQSSVMALELEVAQYNYFDLEDTEPWFRRYNLLLMLTNICLGLYIFYGMTESNDADKNVLCINTQSHYVKKRQNSTTYYI